MPESKIDKDLIKWPLPFMSMPEVVKVTARSKSAIHLDVNEGTFPPFIKNGKRSLVFVAHEVNQIVNCWVRGYSQEQLKEKVKQIILDR